jgi:hypothetical protein
MRVIVAAIVGGIVVFVWTAILHMAMPLGTAMAKIVPSPAP